MPFLRTPPRLSYQRGGWSPGSRHQKHQTLNPTAFLYRFPGPRGPGPFTMKYWWTLGCLPTGLGAPFRLGEFLNTYKQMHVPEGVEEWLSHFVTNPASVLVQSLTELSEKMECLAPPEMDTVGYVAHDPSIAPLLQPLKKVESCLGVEFSRIGVRAVMGSPSLRERGLNEVWEYAELVRESGSTPHRRAGVQWLAARDDHRGTETLPPLAEQQAAAIRPPKTLVEQLLQPSQLEPQDEQLSENVGRLVVPQAASATVAAATSGVPSHTADDERSLIRMLTLFSEGALGRNKPDAAADMLSSCLLFAHDDDVRASVHANLASCWLHSGEYQRAEFHGREAALLRSSARGYSSWATAVAYQDDFEQAYRILADALQAVGKLAEDSAVHAQVPADISSAETDLQLLEATRSHLRAVAAADSSGRSGEPSSRPSMRRAHVAAEQWRGLLRPGSGRVFDNEFDTVVFRNRVYTQKMNPTSHELGSVFRRVAIPSGPRTSTKSMEPL